MKRAEIRVLEQADEMSFGGFLQCEDRETLESNVVPHVLSDLHYQPTEGGLPCQEIS